MALAASTSESPPSSPERLKENAFGSSLSGGKHADLLKSWVLREPQPPPNAPSVFPLPVVLTDPCTRYEMGPSVKMLTPNSFD
jgi:hypothetical protein